MSLAIDGPAAAGKGTLARKLATELGYHYLDTGSLYRATAWQVIRAGKDPHDQDAAEEAARSLHLEDIPDQELRTAEVGAAASVVAAINGVRKAIFDFQRDFAAQDPGAVLDGRDIGTVVCPDADLKLFVTASPEARAHRRFLELVERGEEVDEQELARDLRERDARDRNRKDSPMVQAPDAHLIDTSEMDIEEVFSFAIGLVEEARKADSGQGQA